ncbi:MAG: mercury resistance system transport protein MerF [Anaerolineae bacterium]|nr:mercury resistance system transport protein MerF [Anaerolineae bacterium]
MSLKEVGIVRTVIAAWCCFTPVLVMLFGAVGLSWLADYLDYGLLPALIVFVGIAV